MNHRYTCLTALTVTSAILLTGCSDSSASADADTIAVASTADSCEVSTDSVESGANIGQATFTVTGEALPVSDSDQELFDGVVADYIAFVKNEVSELVPNVDAFAQAYMDGNDAKARDLYATTRVNYERIEPIAEALGTLDPRIDYREVDYLAEADQLEADDPQFTQWTGFHRIENDLWPPAEDDRNADGAPATEKLERKLSGRAPIHRPESH